MIIRYMYMAIPHRCIEYYIIIYVFTNIYANIYISLPTCMSADDI